MNRRQLVKMSKCIDNIELRKIEIEDAQVLSELNNNQEIGKFVVGTPKIVTIDEQLQWIANLKFEKQTRRWMVEYNNKPVGTVILSKIDNLNYVGNMNIKLLPSYQGKGIAKIALEKACKIAFSEMGLFCLTANVLSFNNRSQKLFETLGFRKDGILRSRVIKDNQRYDLINYSLLKTDKL